MRGRAPSCAEYEWHVAQEDRPQTEALARTLEVPRVVAHLLIHRGIDSVERARRFLSPGLEYVGPPDSLADMDRAVERIRRARDDGERVLVFGDYDVDGIAGTALLLRALRRFGLTPCRAGMPNRLEEGYGLNPKHVREAHEQGVGLIITVDNGTTAHESCAVARALGIDVIVTDHHQIKDNPPDVFAFINPKRQDPSHPSADACGAAVAFKLAWALTGEAADIDLAALGTVADIVPLCGENRDLVAAGIAQISERPLVGLVKLGETAGTRMDELTAEHIAFQLAPRINAGGRMGDGARTGLELLLTDDPDEATRLARALDEANQQRREVENTIYRQALQALSGPAGQATAFHPDQRTVVLACRAWHPGVVGIVASRLQSVYYRPTVLIAVDDDGCGRGSARSVDGFDITHALFECREHLVKVGGHANAAGLTIDSAKVGAFREAFEAEARKHLPEGELRRRLDIDAQVAFTEVDGRLISGMDLLRPFGFGNEAPVLCTFGAAVVPGSCRELRGGHLRATLKDGAKIMAAIGFHMGDRLAELEHAGTVDVAFSPQFNTWRGETTIQLVLKDIRPARSA
ncbi:MAG: single-stranded-DNA-specific exonuclease RecJ [Candidatus Hydrogenedentes bacterium]|nr:single-stranded-DNA-specific exonuclease RecJ [Candidatus Hydrogenedentota bacterium]